MKAFYSILILTFVFKPVTCSAQNLVFPAHGITVAGSSTGTVGSTPDRFDSPTGVFVDDTGNIYVYDAGNFRIQKWLPGALSGITVAGGHGNGNNLAANQISYGSGLFVDSAGYIYISDHMNNRVQRWAPGADSGVTVAGGHGAGKASNQLNSPNGIWVTKTGYIYIADGDTISRIQKWPPNATAGITVAGGHGRGTGANQLNYPFTICMDNNNIMYIGDFANHRVQKWAEGDTVGVTVAGGHGGNNGANQLDDIEDIRLDSAGNLYVSDGGVNSRIQRWNVGADSGITVAGDPNRYWLSEFNQPQGIFLYKYRDLYVCDVLNNRVLKYAGIPIGIKDPVNPSTINLSIYPNPNNGNFLLEGTSKEKSIILSVFNSLGEQVYKANIPVVNSLFRQTILLHNVSDGKYTISLNGQPGVVAGFIVSH